MQIKNPKKTLKVLYLYLTVPLLLIALVLGVATWGVLSSAPTERQEDVAAKSEDKGEEAHETSLEHVTGRHCSDREDCRVGESCQDGHCVNLLRERHQKSHAEVKKADDDLGTTGWAAIITAIMGGLTGLLGAVTQTVLAFMKAREARRAR